MSRSTLRRLESEGIMKEVEEQSVQISELRRDFEEMRVRFLEMEERVCGGGKRSKGVAKAIDRTRFNNSQMDLISKPSWS